MQASFVYEYKFLKNHYNFSIHGTSWLHRASTILNPLLLPTDAHNVKKHRVIKTF